MRAAAVLKNWLVKQFAGIDDLIVPATFACLALISLGRQISERGVSGQKWLLAFPQSSAVFKQLCPLYTCDSAADFSSPSNILFLSQVLLTEPLPNLGFDFLFRLAFLCTWHAVRGKSLQPDCEMMSQIHKTLTSSFQLYLLFIIHISFSFERTCTPACTLTHVSVSFVVVCLAVVVLMLFIASAWSGRLHVLGLHYCYL